MSLQKKEQINVNALKKIIANLDDLDIIPSDNMYLNYGVSHKDGFETILRKYLYKASKDGVVKVTYNQKDGKGRYFADGGLSLQSLKREVRHTIAGEYYDDVDMVNAHPVILRHICNTNNIECPYLDTYVENRDKILTDTGLSRDDAKKLYLIIVNSNDIDVKPVNKHMKGFKKEMKSIHEKLYQLNKKEADIHIQKRKLKGKTENMKASYVNSLMCQLENTLLMSIMKYYGNPADCVLCFDGIMLRKGKRKSIKSCMKRLQKKHNIDMKLKVKAMDECLDLSGYDDPDPTDLIDNRAYTVCKEMPTFTRKPSKTFNRPYVSKSLKKSYFTIRKKHNIVVKSDTGTGKTTAFWQYIKDSKAKLNFLSIGSRISLCDEQFKTFSKNGLDCIHYNHTFAKFKTGDNIIMQLDSIYRLRDLDFSKYVLYLDEFAFLIEYLLTSDTMNERRIVCMRLLIKCIRECKRFVCTDADIGNICLTFLDLIGVDYVFHQNRYKHCQNVEAVELGTHALIVEKIKSLDKFLVCTDSKTEAIGLSQELNDSSVVVYTSDTVDMVDIEGHDKVIISPKVITGVDSTKRRHVFAIYKSRTITAKHMIQQINRCRDIVKIYYHFTSKNINKPAFANVDEVLQMLDAQDKLFAFEMLATAEEHKLYRQLYAETLYEWDCLNTNKFLHFKKLLRSRGVQDKDQHLQQSKEKLVTRKQIIEDKIEKLDVEKLQHKEDEDGTVHMPEVSNSVQDILCIPDDKLEEFKTYLVDDILLTKHFNICQFFFKKNEKQKLKKLEDFKMKKATTPKAKMIVLREICNTYGLSLEAGEKIEVTNEVDSETANRMATLYTTSFRFTGKKLEFVDNKTVTKTVTTALKNLFGSDIIKSKRHGRKQTIQYTLQADIITKNKELFNFRNDAADMGEELDLNKLKKKLFT